MFAYVTRPLSVKSGHTPPTQTWWSSGAEICSVITKDFFFLQNFDYCLFRLENYILSRKTNKQQNLNAVSQ